MSVVNVVSVGKCGKVDIEKGNDSLKINCKFSIYRKLIFLISNFPSQAYRVTPQDLSFPH
jgi:hypothetical protein